LIRIVEGVEGEVAMHGDLSVRFGYGKLTPWIDARTNAATLTSGPDALGFASSAPLQPDLEHARLESDFTVKKGQRHWFTLEYYPSHQAAPKMAQADLELERTEKWWLDWISHCQYQGPWRDAVVRSLLTIKGLTFEPTGGIVAAATTS